MPRLLHGAALTLDDRTTARAALIRSEALHCGAHAHQSGSSQAWSSCACDPLDQLHVTGKIGDPKNKHTSEPGG